MENGEKQSKKKRKKEKAVGEKERSKEKKDESKGNREKGEERESGNVNVLFSFLFVTSTDRKRAGIFCFPGNIRPIPGQNRRHRGLVGEVTPT